MGNVLGEQFLSKEEVTEQERGKSANWRGPHS